MNAFKVIGEKETFIFISDKELTLQLNAPHTHTQSPNTFTEKCIKNRNDHTRNDNLCKIVEDKCLLCHKICYRY